MPRIQHSPEAGKTEPAGNTALSRPFGIERARWRRALIMSRTLGAPAIRLALVLLEHASRNHFVREGEILAWPSRETLEQIIGTQRFSIVRALRQLYDECAIVRDRRGGKGPRDTTTIRFNRDWLIVTETDLAKAGALERWPDRSLPSSADTILDEEVNSLTPSDDEQGVKKRSLKGSKIAQKGVKDLTPTLMKNPMTNHPESAARAGEVVFPARVKSTKVGKASSHPPAETVATSSTRKAQLRARRAHQNGSRRRIVLETTLREYELPAEIRAWMSENCGAVSDWDSPRHVEKWRNHHLAHGKIPRDLDASFRLWMAREQEYAVRDQQQQKTTSSTRRGQRRSVMLDAGFNDNEE